MIFISVPAVTVEADTVELFARGSTGAETLTVKVFVTDLDVLSVTIIST